MTGPEHYQEAERLVSTIEAHRLGSNETFAAIEIAQVHATLALAAATQTRQGFTVTDDDVMRCAHGAVICGICGYGAPMGGRS